MIETDSEGMREAQEENRLTRDAKPFSIVLSVMNKAISKYMAEIGRMGGKAGKGSEARRDAALKANRARWHGHVNQCVAVKQKACQGEGNGENKVK